MTRRRQSTLLRRQFLQDSSMLLLGAYAAGCSARKEPSNTLPSPQEEPHFEIQSAPLDFGPRPMSCPLVLPMTKGPCTAKADNQLRQDLREKWPGLRMLLGLRIIDASCHPVQGAQVSIWHTNHEGSYSSQTPANDFCVFNPSYLEQSFFRGRQVSDHAGIVRFLTCYPGWYPGRAVHIHLQVQHGLHASRATQLYFPQDYTNHLFESHPVYRSRGAQDTPNPEDSILAKASALQQQALILDLRHEKGIGLVAMKTVSIVGSPT